MPVEGAPGSGNNAVFSNKFFANLKTVIDTEFPLHHDPVQKPLKYGTAGFRSNAALLPPVAARVSMIAALRSVYSQAKRADEGHAAPCTIGVMITASHNPYLDNGFKIIDVDGGMLASSWEEWCTQAANAASGNELEQVMRNCMAHDPGAFAAGRKSTCTVRFSRDTRPSGEGIVKAGLRTLHLLDHTVADACDPISTPYMHFKVAKENELAATGGAALVSYYDELLSAFDEMYDYACGIAQPQQEKGARSQLVVDCSNGIGSLTLKELLAVAQARASAAAFSSFFETCQVDCNCEDEKMLNTNCGADYAKQHATPSAAMRGWPSTCQGSADASAAHYYALDGDADRVVAFLFDPKCDSQWVLMDGDRIAILYAMLLHKWIGEEQMKTLDVAVVQTAYANGASTEFLEKQLHMKVYTAATGVKNLHPIAHARDVGVYFEANGHGTVLISDRVVTESLSSSTQKAAPLAAMRRLLSQCCGDAIADMMMCEIALRALNMTFQDWAALYTDRPCKQTKVTVSHPGRITNTPDERRALSPAGMQEEIDAAVAAAAARCEAARSFVRPSGTEPVVRVYAEATDPEVCESLSTEVAKIVEKYCN